ncbi:MAG: hypothetical protein JW953_15645 [Anaerolineae bacterium]|nr:hypothetical protein [Anaerolineae bacterium]
MRQDDPHRVGWWGQFNVDSGQTIQWEIGPLKLAIQRLPNEWQIAYEQDETLAEENNEWEQKTTATNLETLGYANLKRYPFQQTHNPLHLLPALADRPVVTRPWTPLHIIANEEAVMFVSSPLWVRLTVADPPKQLLEIPVRRPSDTWFGPSTMEGELCYASRTQGRLNFENIPLQTHRAVTQVTIRNQAKSALVVERLSLPVPYLSLFATAEGVLWTETVTMACTRDTGMAACDIGAIPPPQASQARLINEPRQKPGQNMIVRAFGALFSQIIPPGGD